MDTQFDWLGQLSASSLSQGSAGVAPPTVTFGSPGPDAFGTRTTADRPAPPLFHANISTDSIQKHEPRDDSASIPLSLRAQELSLEESKTYMRWYLDILARTGLRTVAISDIYHFLGNFKIGAETKEKINRLFSKILLLINIGEFFAVLRIVSHALQGHEPARVLIKRLTGVPLPPSILSKKRQSDETEEFENGMHAAAAAPDPGAPLDIDLFTQFMLTGQRPDERPKQRKQRKLKNVKFSDQVVTDVQHTYLPADSPLLASSQIDYLLPMDQLLSRIGTNGGHLANSLAVPLQDFRMTSPDPEEKQILQDMEPQMNHFRNLHSVDTILVDGVPSNIHLQPGLDFHLPRHLLPQPPLLKPNMTGPAQMAQMTYNTPSLRADYGLESAADSWTQPLRPNVTGPLDMARFLSPSEAESPAVSLQAFTSQMTGNTMNNTQQNARIGYAPDLRLATLSPPPVPTTRRARSSSQPSPLNFAWPSANEPEPETEEPPSFDSNGYASQSQYLGDFIRPPVPSGPPVPPRSPVGQFAAEPQQQRARPPAPPPRLRRTSSSASTGQHPPPLPAKVPNEPVYSSGTGASSTADILDDLRALQEEVDRIKTLSGGF